MKEKGGDIRLDPQQHAAAHCSVNAVVSAGAGSGKTTVLAERFLNLILSGAAEVDNILTLTFTRKAAAEMRARIYRRLLNERGNPRVERQLQRFEEAHIATLDSFCARLVRNWSSHYGVSPDFSMDEERLDALCLNTAMDFLFSRRDNPVLGRFIAENSFSTVRCDFFARLGREYFTAASEHDPEGQYRRQIKMLSEDAVRLGAEISSEAGKFIGADAGGSAIMDSMLRVCTRLQSFSRALQEGAWAGVTDFLDELSAVRLPGSNVKNPDLIELRDSLLLLRERCALLADISGTMAVSDDLKVLFSLTAEFGKKIASEKRRRSLLGFQDVMDLAVRILKENRELRQHYKEQFSYIMIDEFQDNNIRQKELLFLLAERSDCFSADIPQAECLAGEKLFFVGDEKQSIYRFRGADVSVFKGLSENLLRARGSSIFLDTNYRSGEKLIRFFNGLFRKVMEDAREAYEAEFSPLKPCGGGISLESVIQVFYKPDGGRDGEELLSNDDAEAYSICRWIQENVENDALLIEGGEGGRPADYDDIAVLMRSTSNQIRYERMFRLFGIPYSSGSVRSLFLEAPVNDIYNLLQTAVYPEDRTAYAALLRSPLVHLSDTAVLELLLEGSPPFEGTRETLSGFSAEDAGKYRAAASMYARIVSSIDRRSAAESIAGIWYRYGYRYTLLRQKSSHTYLEYFEYFYQFALKFGGGSCAEFLDSFRSQLGSYERLREMDFVHDRSGGVNLLTIHKAKGLEFPVVVLANAGNQGRPGGGGSEPYYLSERAGLTLGLRRADGKGRYNYFYSESKEEDELMEAAELKRLLYVALTRAQYHLVISGVFNRRNRNKENNHLLMVLNAVAEEDEGTWSVRNEFKDLLSLKQLPDIPVSEEKRHYSGRKKTDAASLAADLLKLPCRERSYPLNESNVTALNAWYEARGREAGVQHVERRLPGLQADDLLEEGRLEAVFGTLTHYLMERQFSGEAVPVKGPADLPFRIRKDLSGTELDRLFADASALVSSFLASSLAGKIRQAERREAELSFTTVITTEENREFFVSGQIDLLCIYPDEALVIDWKTDGYFREKEYELQMACYRKAAKELAGREARVIIVYLRSGQQVRSGTELPLSAIISDYQRKMFPPEVSPAPKPTDTT